MENGAGNGRPGTVPWTSATIVPVVIAVLAALGFWWNAADPKARINDIENRQFELRKELADKLDHYLTISEHKEYQARIAKLVDSLTDRDIAFLTKDAFRAWKDERDIAFAALHASVLRIEDHYVPRTENAIMTQRIDKLYNLYETLLLRDGSKIHPSNFTTGETPISYKPPENHIAAKDTPPAADPPALSSASPVYRAKKTTVRKKRRISQPHRWRVSDFWTAQILRIP